MSNQYTPIAAYDEDTSDSLSNGVHSISSRSFEGGLPFFPFTSEFDEATENIETLSSQTKKIRKKRNAYQKIDDDLRLQLLEAVQQNGETLKAASKRLKINYSSAKSIIHTFRKEGRILKKSALERTVNFCHFPLGEIDLNTMNNYAHQFQGERFTLQTTEYPKQSDYYQGSVTTTTYSENSLSSPMLGLSDNFTQLLLGSNIGGSQYLTEEVKIPNLAITEPAENIFIDGSQDAAQGLEIPVLDLTPTPTSIPLESTKLAEGFYMNYSNSPLSGGNGNMFQERSDSNNHRMCQKEFDSFSELVNAFQSQPRSNDETGVDLQIPKLLHYNSSHFSRQERAELSLRRDDSINSSEWSAIIETTGINVCKGYLDAQSMLCDALKPTSFLNNIVQMQMASAGGNADNNWSQ